MDKDYQGAVKEFILHTNCQWAMLINRLFPSSIPFSFCWNTFYDIKNTLGAISKYPDSNYAFAPSCGGDSITGVSSSRKSGYLNLYSEGLKTTIRPEKLIFQYLKQRPECSFFFLEETKNKRSHVIVSKGSALNSEWIDSGWHKDYQVDDLRVIIEDWLNLKLCNKRSILRSLNNYFLNPSDRCGF